MIIDDLLEEFKSSGVNVDDEVTIVRDDEGDAIIYDLISEAVPLRVLVDSINEGNLVRVEVSTPVVKNDAYYKYANDLNLERKNVDLMTYMYSELNRPELIVSSDYVEAKGVAELYAMILKTQEAMVDVVKAK